MKIIAIADTHGSNFVDDIPECDVCCIVGDISPVKCSHSHGNQKYWFENHFINQIIRLTEKVKHIIFIAGNHDHFLYNEHISNNSFGVKAQLPSNVYYLVDESVVIDGIKFYGTPWVHAPTWADVGPDSKVWNFASKNEVFLSAIYKDIPNDTNILLCHGPAHGFCDVILDRGIADRNMRIFENSIVYEHVGTRPLTLRLLEIAKQDNCKLKYVLSGHIHSAEHEFETLQPDMDKPAIKLACVSFLNEYYEKGDYKPLEIKYEYK